MTANETMSANDKNLREPFAACRRSRTLAFQRVAVPDLLRQAAISGTCASVVSSAALALSGMRDCNSAFAPVNAISHWVWGDRAFHTSAPSFRHTATGYVIHHAMSVFWALFFEVAVATRARPLRAIHLAIAGVAVAAVAGIVDLRCTPERLTPGFERKLSPLTLGFVYLAFAAALPLYRIFSRRP